MGFRPSQTMISILFRRHRHYPKSTVLCPRNLLGSSMPRQILLSNNFLQVEFAIFAALHSNIYHVRRQDQMFASSVSHVAPPFQSSVNGHVTEGQATSGSSAKRYPHLCLPIMLGGQEKVECTWPGCASILKKDSHTRHVDNIHLRKIKAICTRCPGAH